MHKGQKTGFLLALLPGTAAVQAAAVPARAHLPPSQQQIYGPPAEAVEGTWRSASDDAAARPCDGRARERSPRRKSRGAPDKIKQKVCRRRAGGCHKARCGAATFPSPGHRSILPG